MKTISQRKDDDSPDEIYIEWLDALEDELRALDDAPVECDVMTYAISFLLTQAGIAHTMLCGTAKDLRIGDVIMPHCWIALDTGWLIDFRLRMWLGEQDHIPHGIFHPSETTGFEYKGFPITAAGIDYEALVLMTEGMISHAKVARPVKHQGREKA